MNLRIAAGIVHYKDPQSVRELVASMDSWTLQPECILVADNSSELTASEATESFEVLDMGGNLGYAAAVNSLASAALELGFDALLLLTQDARCEDTCLEILAETMDRSERCNVVAPRIFYASNPDKLFSRGGVITKYGRTLHPGQGGNRPAASSRPRPVDWADGAVLLLKLSEWRHSGGFDEAYFLYVEEVDYQWRAKRNNQPTLLVDDAVAYQEPGNYTLYYKYRNLIYFTTKFRLELRRWPWPLAFPKDGLKMLIAGRPDQLLWAIRGVWDGYRGAMGPPPRSVMGPRSEAMRPSPTRPSGTTLVVVTEQGPEKSAPGVRRRIEHICSDARSRGAAVAVIPLSSEGERHKLGRIKDALRSDLPLERGQRVIVTGLASPHMLLLAARLQRQGWEVVYDCCDSWMLQARARFRSSQRVLALISVAGAVLQILTSRKIPITYISRRDQLSDGMLNLGRRTEVLPPFVDDRFRALRGFSGSASRLVMSGDFESFHVQEGSEALLESWNLISEVLRSRIHLDIYGPGSRSLREVPNSTRHGYVDNQLDLYSGNTVIFIPNTLGSGVPNKLLEAVAAQRPIIVHESMEPLIEPHPWVRYWRDTSTLVKAIESLASDPLPRSVNRVSLSSSTWAQ